MRVALLVKPGTFPIYNKHKQIAVLEPFDDSCMSVEREPAGRTESLANRDWGYPPLTIFVHHRLH